MELGDMLLRLGLAIVLGGILGLEREISRQDAGLRTHLLVTLGSCVFSLVSITGALDDDSSDGTRIASNVVVGIGFLGAGTIMQQHGSVRGLTTAAGIWVAAAIGMAAAFGNFTLAAAATLLAVFLLTGLSLFERRFLAPRLDDRVPKGEAPKADQREGG
ncbi:MAG TPA: MgtC/SapB family protein [Myxococcaceae bacterium]|nr:MgtC/SapB family protein [Myxococcaceae bacterium]